jgi:hypothetical protein
MSLLLIASAASAGIRENRETASRILLERMGQGRFDIDTEIYGPGFVAHGFGRDYTLAEDQVSGRSLRAAFPDLAVRIGRVIGEGDLVAVHWYAAGTNSVAVGAFPGAGRRISLDGMSFFRFSDGRIVEEWSTYDNLGLMQQLGLVGAPPN